MPRLVRSVPLPARLSLQLFTQVLTQLLTQLQTPLQTPLRRVLRRARQLPLQPTRHAARRATARLSSALSHLRVGATTAPDAGMSTAEYAVGTVAACGFAALLWTVLHSAAVQHALSALVLRALGML